MSVLFLGRLLGLIRDLIVAPLFGAGAQVDALVAARTIPELVLAVTAAGAVRSVLVPALSQLSQLDDDEAGAWKAVSIASNWLIVAVLVLALLGVMFPRQFVNLFAPGLDSERQLLASQQLGILLLACVFQVVAAVLAAMLNYRGRYSLPSVGPALINGAIIALTLLLWQRLSIMAVSLGWLVGSLVNLIIQILSAIRAKIHYSASLNPFVRGVRYTWLLMIPVMLSQALLDSRFIVERQFASWLPTGALAMLNYAYRISILPQTIVANSVVVVSLPILSRLYAESKTDDFMQALIHGLRLTLVGIVPFAAVFVGLATPTIRLLLQRGAFKATDTALTADLLLWYAIALLVGSGALLLMQAFYAMGDGKSPILAMAGGIVVQVVVSAALVRSLSTVAIALATSAGVGVSLLILISRLQRRLELRWPTQWYMFLLQMSVAGLAMGGTCALMYTTSLRLQENWVISYSAAIVAGFGIYLLLIWRMRIRELQLLTVRLHAVSKRWLRKR